MKTWFHGDLCLNEWTTKKKTSRPRKIPIITFLLCKMSGFYTAKAKLKHAKVRGKGQNIVTAPVQEDPLTVTVFSSKSIS